MRKAFSVFMRVARSVIGSVVLCVGGYYLCVGLNIGTAYIISSLKNLWTYVSSNHNALICGLVILLFGALLADWFIALMKKLFRNKKSKDKKDSRDTNK